MSSNAFSLILLTKFADKSDANRGFLAVDSIYLINTKDIKGSNIAALLVLYLLFSDGISQVLCFDGG